MYSEQFLLRCLNKEFKLLGRLNTLFCSRKLNVQVQWLRGISPKGRVRLGVDVDLGVLIKVSKQLMR